MQSPTFPRQLHPRDCNVCRLCRCCSELRGSWRPDSPWESPADSRSDSADTNWTFTWLLPTDVKEVFGAWQNFLRKRVLCSPADNVLSSTWHKNTSSSVTEDRTKSLLREGEGEGERERERERERRWHHDRVHTTHHKQTQCQVHHISSSLRQPHCYSLPSFPFPASCCIDSGSSSSSWSNSSCMFLLALPSSRRCISSVA